VACNTGEPSHCSSQEKCKLEGRVTECPLFPWSADAASTFSLQEDRVIQSLKKYFPASRPDLSETPDAEAIICHSQRKEVLSISNRYY